MPRQINSDISRAARAVLERALLPRETPLAEGRMHYVRREIVAVMGSEAWGQTNDYVFVTDARLLWTQWLGPGRIGAETRSVREPLRGRFHVVLGD